MLGCKDTSALLVSLEVKALWGAVFQGSQRTSVYVPWVVTCNVRLKDFPSGCLILVGGTYAQNFLITFWLILDSINRGCPCFHTSIASTGSHPLSTWSLCNRKQTGDELICECMCYYMIQELLPCTYPNSWNRCYSIPSENPSLPDLRAPRLHSLQLCMAKKIHALFQTHPVAT